MSGVVIEVKANDSEVQIMLGRLLTKLGNLTPVMNTIGEIVRSSVIQNFREGGRPDKWRPTKVINRARKGKRIYKLDKSGRYDSVPHVRGDEP